MRGMKLQKGKNLPAHNQRTQELVFEALCKQHGLPMPVAEYKWHPDRKFLADWCFEGWLLIEKDGGLFGRGSPCPLCKRRNPGAHSSIGQMQRDREKDREAILLGFVTLRFWPSEFTDGSAFAFIKRVLDSREEQP